MNDIANNKLYKVLRKIVNIGFWVSVGAFFATLILILVYPETMSSLNMSFEGFAISGTLISDKEFLGAWAVTSFALKYLCGIFGIWMLKNVVNSFQSDTPFTSKNVNRIRLIAVAVLVQSYIKQISNYLLAKNIDITAGTDIIFQPRFTIITEGAVLALCIFILADVFRLGCALQHEHDTTV